MQLIKQTLAFSSSRYVLMALGLARNLIVARVLGPESYGIWVIVTVVLTYGDQMHLGLRHAGDKEIPYWRAVAGEGEAVRIANTIYGGILLLTAALSGTMVLGVAMFNERMGIGILSMLGVILLSDQVSRFHLMILRALKQFILSSKLEIVFETIRTVVVSILVILYQLQGAVVGVLFASLGSSTILAWLHRSKLRPKLEFQYLRKVFPIGFSLFVSGMLFVLILNLDRLLGSISLTQGDLGLYGMAAILSQLPLSIAQSVGTVLFPTLSERFGQEKNTVGVHELFSRSMSAIAYVGPFVAVCFLIVAEVLVGLFLPAYGAAVPLIRILTFGVVFLTLLPVSMGVLMSVGENRALVGGEVTTLALLAPLYVTMVLSPKPEVLATITSGGFIFFSLISFYRVSRVLGLSAGQALRDLWLKHIPCVGTMALLVFFMVIGSPASADIIGLALSGVMKLLAAIVLYALLALLQNKWVGVLTVLRGWAKHE